MKKKYIWKNYKLISLLIVLFFLIGCNVSTQKPTPENDKKESPKPPETLSKLEEDILTVMYDLDSVTALEKAIQKQKDIESKEDTSMEVASTSSGQGQQDGQKQSQSSGEEEKKKEEEKQKKIEEEIDLEGLIKETEIIIPLLDANEAKGSFAENPTPPNDINKVWNKISDSVKEVHKKWNVLESNLTSVNVPNSKSEEFEDILNNLTLSVMSKNRLNSLKLANELTRITTDFRSYYNGVADHSIYSMYYNIRGSILAAASDDYTTAIKHLNEASNSGAALRQDLINQNSQDVLQKFELSIEDLKKSLESKNFILSQIKAPIVINNIKLIEDEFKTIKKQ